MDSDTPVRKHRDGGGRGGYRPGAGRKPGSTNVMSKAAREAARESGLLPHEILLSIARGEPQVLKVPTGSRKADGSYEYEEQLVGVDLESIKDAAKAAAPYYAPKLSTVETIQGVSEDDLDAIIARAAAEAGVGLGTGGEGPAREGEDGADRTTGRKRVPLT